MAANSSRKPKLVGKAKLEAQRESGFRFDRRPVDSLTRDAERLEYYKRRSLMEKIRNAFRTMSYRSAPTIGEEHLRRQDARVNIAQGAVDGKLLNGRELSQMQKDREKLPQTLLPDYLRHIQNFHHYRSDIESLQSGLPVLHLSPSERKDKLEKVQSRRNGNHDPGSERKGVKTANARNHFYMLPCRKPIKSTRTTSGSKGDFKDFENSAGLAEAKGINKRIVCKNTDKVKTFGGEINDGFQSGNVNGQEQNAFVRSKTNDADAPSAYPREHDDAGIVNCRISQGSDRSPRAPLTTPDDFSGRSSILTFRHFSSQEDFNERTEGAAPTLSSANAKSVFRASLAPFHSRFPQLKACDSNVARTPFKRTPKNQVIPDWQHYRILCDAFRPTVPYERFHSQRNSLRYRKPRYVTSTELDYYIHVVTETNKTSSMFCAS